jgi:Fe2+ transport system protein B
MIAGRTDARCGRHWSLFLCWFTLYWLCSAFRHWPVVRRETNSWKWPLFMQGYMTALAWMASFAIYQVGRALGWG